MEDQTHLQDVLREPSIHELEQPEKYSQREAGKSDPL